MSLLEAPGVLNMAERGLSGPGFRQFCSQLFVSFYWLQLCVYALLLAGIVTTANTGLSLLNIAREYWSMGAYNPVNFKKVEFKPGSNARILGIVNWFKNSTC